MRSKVWNFAVFRFFLKLGFTTHFYSSDIETADTIRKLYDSIYRYRTDISILRHRSITSTIVQTELSTISWRHRWCVLIINIVVLNVTLTVLAVLLIVSRYKHHWSYILNSCSSFVTCLFPDNNHFKRFHAGIGYRAKEHRTGPKRPVIWRFI